MSSKIEVPRETLANSLKDGSSDPVVCASYRKAVEDIRALLAAPVVERQPAMAWALLNGNGQVRDLTDRWDVAKHWDGLVQSLYTVPPELAELQATIARLTALITEVVEKQNYELEHRGARYRARWEETLQKLKSATGEGKSHE